MTIGFDVTWMNKLNMAGGAYQYAIRLISALKKYSDIKIVVFIDPGGRGIFDKLMDGENFRVIVEETSESFNYVLKTEKIDVIHTPMQFFFNSTTTVPMISTLHDLQHVHYPEFFTEQEIRFRELYYRKTAEFSERVIVSFKHVKEDVTRHFDIPSESIDVCPLGMPEPRMLDQSNFQDIKERYHIQDSYLFYSANTWRHKNHIGLIRALKTLRDEHGMTIQLVCTGQKLDNHFPEIQSVIDEAGLRDSVNFTGYIPEDDMFLLLKNSTLAVIPTMYEAGSFPLMEAMVYETPVICSNVTSLPETIGDPRFLFNPENIEEIAEKIEGMLRSDQLREDNKENSRNCLKERSWAQSVPHFIDSYTRAIASFSFNNNKTLNKSAQNLDILTHRFIRHKNSQINYLRNQVSSLKIQISSQNTRISSQDTQINTLRDQKVILTSHKERLKTDVREIKLENRELKAGLKRHKKEKKELLNSLSWKITAPLRHLWDIAAGVRLKTFDEYLKKGRTSLGSLVDKIIPARDISRISSFSIPGKNSDELFIYIDPGFFSDWGHYTSFATCIHEETKKRNVDLWHFSTGDISDESANLFSLIPIFKFRAMLPQDAGFVDSNFLQRGQGVLKGLQQLIFDKETGDIFLSFTASINEILNVLTSSGAKYKKISLYMYTSHPLHIAIFAEILNQPEYQSLDINLHLCLFYLNLDFCLGNTVSSYENLLKLTSNSLEKYDPKMRIKIYADSQRTIARYQPFYKRKFSLSPIPLGKPSERVDAGREQTESTIPEPVKGEKTDPEHITIGYFGFAHEKQGYQLFKSLYDELTHDKKYFNVRFIVRHNTKFSSAKISLSAKTFQLHNDRIIHLDGNFLSPEVYQKNLNACDIVVIPHSRDHYPTQTSGLFTDSLIRGKTVIIPQNTWMSDQIEQYGSGKTFQSDNRDSFLKAVKHVLDHYNDYKSRTTRNMEAFLNFHSTVSMFDLFSIGRQKDIKTDSLNIPDIDLKKFKDIHKGKRCFIVGNGPSLNTMDLNKLAGEFVFCTNAFFLIFPRISWRPQFFTCVDTRVLPDRSEGIIKMHSNNPDMLLFFPQVMVNHETNEVTPTTHYIPPAPNRVYFNQVIPDKDDLPFDAFSMDASTQVIQPYSVTITALQLALYLGFEPIYLIGCDTNYVVPETVIKDGNDPKLGKFLFTSTEDDDPNHFCPDYFGKGMRWHHPQVHNMIWHYKMAHEASALHGKHIYNATVGGKLEVFPRVNFEDLF